MFFTWLHDSAGCGGANLRDPRGGLAKGIPRKTATGCANPSKLTNFPRTLPCTVSIWGSVVPQDAAPDAAPSCPGDAEGLGSGRLERLCLSMNAGRRALCLVSDDFSNKGGGLLPGLVRANERAKAASSRVGWELAASCLPRCGYSESGSAQVYHVLSLHKGG